MKTIPNYAINDRESFGGDILVANELGFLYGKVSFPNADLDRWLAVQTFHNEVLEMSRSGKVIDDVSILLLCEKILSENLNSDTIDGVRRDKLCDATVDLRKYVEDFKFRPNWIKENFPSVWRDIKNRVSNENLIVIPVQMNRYIQVLKYISNLAEDSDAEVYVGGIDPSYTGHVSVSLKRMRVTGIQKMSEFFGRLRFCDSIDLEVFENRAEVAFTVGHIMMKESDFHANVKQKKAWTLQWNQSLRKEF